VLQNFAYEAPARRLLRVLSFWTASERGASPAAGREEDVESGARICGGRRWRAREKSGAGKTVRAFTRMLVIVSSRARCGLNWYLGVGSRSAIMLDMCYVHGKGF
jgi:hypothetical protein